MRQATNGAHPPESIRILSSVALIALLAGCQGSLPGNGGGDATRATPIGESVQLIERDVEAPEVFSAKDRALWDGRPSLGGVWVAAPDVRDPERVIIRNEDNGKFVIGALFKRERSNPGPALQLSSDAAAALGILAGSPTSIDVVALRREESAAPTPAPATSAPLAEAEAEAGPIAEEIVQTAAAPVAEAPRPDAIAAASAALETVDAEGETPEASIEAAAAIPGPIPEAELRAPARQNFFGRLFGKRRAANVDAPAAMPDQTVMPTPVDVSATGAAAPAVTATSLDTTPVRTASASPAPVRATGLDRPYVQIGIFSVEQNARDIATSLSTAGIVPTVLEQESRGRTFWRVIVGPATTTGDRAAVIRKAKSMGFTDAFATRG
ncbi:SPOR domain-containing protein [Jannaschia donghaensis]|uniref:Sporulation related domain protein n=1 Tax=Jannaschia donghaensis TaxID=420998 RepID=A0A0M6YPB4_9RHOB|nr:SPOR domain-containing protein [Jannaschia donghaensis]CTQ50856.1 Sporulation related domain protein [Jannaschia donghaensis]